jgi:hypothetical protein
MDYGYLAGKFRLGRFLKPKPEDTILLPYDVIRLKLFGARKTEVLFSEIKLYCTVLLSIKMITNMFHDVCKYSLQLNGQFPMV